MIDKKNSSGRHTNDSGRKSHNIVSSDVTKKGLRNHDILVADIISIHDRVEKRHTKIDGFEKSKIL